MTYLRSWWGGPGHFTPSQSLLYIGKGEEEMGGGGEVQETKVSIRKNNEYLKTKYYDFINTITIVQWRRHNAKTLVNNLLFSHCFWLTFSKAFQNFTHKITLTLSLFKICLKKSLWQTSLKIISLLPPTFLLDAMTYSKSKLWSWHFRTNKALIEALW